MIRRKWECKTEPRVQLRDGDGTVLMTSLISGPEELLGKGRLFSIITLNPGCSIGHHVHEGESELFYIIRGTAEYYDNGTLRTVHAGDVTICGPGQEHGIANRTEEVTEVAAVILYE